MLAQSDRTPRFLWARGAELVPLDTARIPVLGSRVSVDWRGITLREALLDISSKTGIKLMYADDIVSTTAPVRLRADNITVAAALTDLLGAATVDIVFTGATSVSLVRRAAPPPLLAPPAPPAAAPAGGIRGKVTDKGSGTPLVAATIQVEGTQLGAITADDGSYRIAGVAPGVHVLNARRVGYTPAKQTVTVADNQTATADFALEASASSLQAIVTTATGEQRRIELGNAVATLDASGRTASTAVKDIGDLMAAQMTGVQVMDASITGGASRIRIRGQSSMALTNDPIYIIDGVRMTSVTSGAGTGGGTVPSRANDIDPEQIENIEVVKGPSAATLYGTDAANGVIVITTKRGKAGKAAWSGHVEQGQLVDHNNYPATYALLGHSPGSTTQRRCFTYDIAEGTCALDSASVLNLWTNPDLTTLKIGSRQLIGGQVSGGTDQIRYFLSADMNQETGPVGLPAVDQRRFDSLGVAIRPNMSRPNNLQQLSLRMNLNAAVTPTFDLAVSTAFMSIDQRFPQSENGGHGSYVQAMEFGPGYAAGPGYTGVGVVGEKLYGYSGMTPGEIFQYVSTQNVQRFIGSSTASWHPLSWLQGRADIGYDLTAEDDNQLQRLGEGPTSGTALLGSASDSRVTLGNFTANLGATAQWQLRPWAQLKSTIGAQYVLKDQTVTTGTGSQLAPGAESPSQGAVFAVASSTSPAKTLGEFIEEQLALHDRLYITGAIRADKNSAFGVNYAGAYYPKAAVSWILSNESFFPKIRGLDELRVRSSVGASGVQPGATSALRTYAVTNVVFGGTTVAGLSQSNPGNPNLKPERSSEFESGLDAKMFGERVNLELTYYKRNTNDALITQPVAPSAGVAGYLSNLGGVQNSGVEYQLRTQILDGREFGWDLTYGGSFNQNKIVSLGPIVSPPFTNPQVGYPINATFLRTITYTDANHTGLLTRSEVTISPASSQVFAGPPNPPTQISLTSGFEMLNRRLRISVFVDRKWGARAGDLELMLPCLVATSCGDLQRMNAPLWYQARAIAVKQGVTSGYNEDASFTRLREISATYDLGESLARRYLRGKAARITLAVRNVALWKHGWTGTDPENFYGSSADLGTAGSQDVAPTAPPMYTMLRLNITY
jgi:TonB-linked SusC/RagA family outer membrane protein